MEAQGKVIAILEARSGVSKAGREWMSQEYVIETPGQYPKRICFNLFGADRINEAHIQMGEDIIIEFDIDAREWQGKWFTSINAFRVTRPTAVAPMAGEPTMQDAPFAADPFNQPAPMQNAPFSDSLPIDSGDDLPF
ncbi:MAG: DUF3127 domain-containing protein [Paludibacteraceae bacterium]|nr:DUF3127 domain-containing protein [Paludibacteraceae bacterium]